MNINLFSGRLSNKGFLIQLIVLVVICWLTYSFRLSPTVSSPVFLVFMMSVIVGYFVVPAYYVSMVVRRLHDLGYSGFWSLLVVVSLLSLYIYPILRFNQVLPQNSSLIFAVIGILNGLFALYLMIKAGQKSKNKYGLPQ